ncbi:putative acyltransferase [Clostridium puniceum]|uniref:Putative acyltransferase n=1 Tax=Clostridium puniceum TaxID=29367 RepID=A0A1S8T196_9CLOT|nr:GNAT family N-acetyltransferase [Clostridium puniceum]OOM71443.1 putative acyltransferase [Clostridium puniceum]
MNNWQIKKFDELSLKQLYGITRSRCEVFIQEQKIVCEEELDGLDDKCIHVFLEQNERVSAYCRIVPKGISYENVSIGRVLVLKEFRRKGIAQEMLDVTSEYIKGNFVDSKIVLSAQVYAKTLYESAGFIANNKIYEEAGIPHVKMYKMFN